MLDNVNSTGKRLISQSSATVLHSPPSSATVVDWFHDCVTRGRSEVFTEIVTLTPEMAKLLLAANHENRTINKRAVETYKDDILADRWALNGESIKVATDGSLNDGQHRCWGVVESGKSIRTAITFGLPRDSRMTLDQGKARSVSDYLSIESSVKNATTAAGIARMLLFYRLGVTPNGFGAPTRLAVRAEYWENDKDINAAAHYVQGFSVRIVGGPTIVGAAFIVARRINPAAREFFDKLIKGTDLSEGDPILTVRNKLMSGQRIAQLDKMRLILRAFDAWSQGKSLSKIYERSKTTKTAGR